MIRRLELVSKPGATPSHHQTADMAPKRQRHLVVPPLIHHPSPQWGTQHLIALGPSIVWKYKWSLLKMGKLHHHPHIPGRNQLWKTWSEMAKPSLTEEVVMDPGWAVLFYGWQSLGKGLSLGEVWDAMFTLSGATGWVGKQAHLNANPVSLDEGWWLITQAITKWCIKPRGPRHPCSIQAASLPFNFCNQDHSPWTAKHKNAAEWWEVTRCDSGPSHQEWGHALQKGWDQGQMQKDQWTNQPTSPSPSPDHRFESDPSSVLTSSSVSLRSNTSGGSRHSHCGQWCQGSPEVTWRSMCQSSKRRTQKMPSPTKVVTGI